MLFSAARSRTTPFTTAASSVCPFQSASVAAGAAPSRPRSVCSCRTRSRIWASIARSCTRLGEAGAGAGGTFSAGVGWTRNSDSGVWARNRYGVGAPRALAVEGEAGGRGSDPLACFSMLVRCRGRGGDLMASGRPMMVGEPAAPPRRASDTSTRSDALGVNAVDCRSARSGPRPAPPRLVGVTYATSSCSSCRLDSRSDVRAARPSSPKPHVRPTGPPRSGASPLRLSSSSHPSSAPPTGLTPRCSVAGLCALAGVCVEMDAVVAEVAAEVAVVHSVWTANDAASSDWDRDWDPEGPPSPAPPGPGTPAPPFTACRFFFFGDSDRTSELSPLTDRSVVSSSTLSVADESAGPRPSPASGRARGSGGRSDGPAAPGSLRASARQVRLASSSFFRWPGGMVMRANAAISPRSASVRAASESASS